MSYIAEGSGYLALRQTAQDVDELKTRMRERYEAQCADAMNLTDSSIHKESVQRAYEAKKESLAHMPLCMWLQQEFFNLGFYETDMSEEPESALLNIGMSFDANYCEDQIREFLVSLAPYVTEGSFSFVGEDSSHWRLAFKCGEWVLQPGEIVYEDADAIPAVLSYPAFSENADSFEALLSTLQERMETDDRSAMLRGKAFLAAYRERNPDGMILALTGWNLQSLGAIAGIWPDTEGVVLS